MSLKHAVLGLVLERRGYGYDLVQRLTDRLGPAWQLTPSAVYFALDQLSDAGLIAAVAGTGADDRQGGQRAARVVYEATHLGVAAFAEWLARPVPRPEPVRSALLLKVAVVDEPNRAPLAAAMAHEETQIERLRDACAAAPARDHARLPIIAAIGRLDADLRWLRLARTALASR